ncbi:hypothetical protein JKY72_03945 [Candidatus Gracilibacteria bacterium]|nr:hypothetical protein [Candidatus Gracilibacteria bacterium]
MGMEEVELKNGTFEVDLIVESTMAALTALEKSNFFVFSDLVMKCRYESHELVAITARELMRLGMVDKERGVVQEHVKNVLLSAVRGEGLMAILGSPLAEEGE